MAVLTKLGVAKAGTLATATGSKVGIGAVAIATSALGFSEDIFLKMVILVPICIVIVIVIAIVEALVCKYRKRKYQEAANNVVIKERLGGITDKEKIKFISIIRITICKLIDKDVINPEETADLIKRIERGCIQLSQAFLIVDILLKESPSAYIKKSLLKKLMEKLNELEKAHKDSFLSDADFEKRVGDIISAATAQAATKEGFLSNVDFEKTAGDISNAVSEKATVALDLFKDAKKGIFNRLKN